MSAANPPVPGSSPVSEAEELARVVPVVERLCRETDVPVSVDTTKAAVAAAALDAGACVVNDVSGLRWDAAMPGLCAGSGCGVVAMHTRGRPAEMQAGLTEDSYGDVVAEVRAHLADRLAALTDAGIAGGAVLLDPGVGFGKTAAHNLALLRGVPALRSLGRPVLDRAQPQAVPEGVVGAGGRGADGGDGRGLGRAGRVGGGLAAGPRRGGRAGRAGGVGGGYDGLSPERKLRPASAASGSSSEARTTHGRSLRSGLKPLQNTGANIRQKFSAKTRHPARRPHSAASIRSAFAVSAVNRALSRSAVGSSYSASPTSKFR